MPRPPVSDQDYRRLLALRTDLRRFLRWSEDRAREAGLTPAQHQLLLAIRGHDPPQAATVADIADHLLVRHHSAVELIDRAEEAGLVSRRIDQHDRRVVRLVLTPRGRAALRELSAQHLDELARLRPRIGALARGLDEPTAGRTRSASAGVVR